MRIRSFIFGGEAENESCQGLEEFYLLLMLYYIGSDNGSFSPKWFLSECVGVFSNLLEIRYFSY